MHERDDYAEHAQPLLVTQQPQRFSILSSIARAIVSLTLLAVLLLAFGAAIWGYLLRNDLRDDLAAEIERTPVRAHLIVAYRDELDARTRQMQVERSVVPPPTLEEIYPSVMAARQGIGGPAAWDPNQDLLSTIDLLQQDNTDIRWANDTIRTQARRRLNPQRPVDGRTP